MRKLKQGFHRVISSQSGETIAESLVSLLVLSLALFTVAVIVRTAMSITAAATRNAENMQDVINFASHLEGGELEYTLNGEDKTITVKDGTLRLLFYYNSGGANLPLSTEHNIAYVTGEGLTAFEPN